MSEKVVSITLADGTAEGLLFAPDSAPHPGVIFLTDIIGMRDSQRQMAERIANEGYTVLVPQIFFRSGALPLFDHTPSFGDDRTMKRLGELRGPLTPDAQEKDAAAYVDFLAAQDGVAPGPMGVVGYCFSGAFALRTAAVQPARIAAAASFHGGGLYKDDDTSPHRVLPRVKARLYFGHAENDRSMPKEAIEQLEAALAAWGGKYESEVYEGAAHGWTVPDFPVHNPAQADRAHAKLTELFAAALGA